MHDFSKKCFKTFDVFYKEKFRCSPKHRHKKRKDRIESFPFCYVLCSQAAKRQLEKTQRLCTKPHGILKKSVKGVAIFL